MLLTPRGHSSGTLSIALYCGAQGCWPHDSHPPRREPGHLHREAGLSPPLLTEITFLKLDKTTRTLEYNTQDIV